MIEKMVIASEIMPNADEMFRYLGGLQKLGAKKCILVQCMNPKETTEEVTVFLDTIMEENLHSQKEILEGQGFLVETRIRNGFIKQEINTIAVEEKCDLIVVAARREDRITGYPFDDAAFEVIEHADKPVLLIRENADATQGMKLTDHILFATDFSDNAGIAFRAVEQMVAKGIKKVSIIHVQDKTRIEPHLVDQLDKFNEIDNQRLALLKAKLVTRGCSKVDTILAYGSPKYELNKFIRENGVTLTVMGSQGRGFVDELFVGGVSQNIARDSLSSVLLIPTIYRWDKE